MKRKPERGGDRERGCSGQNNATERQRQIKRETNREREVKAKREKERERARKR